MAHQTIVLLLVALRSCRRALACSMVVGALLATTAAWAEPPDRPGLGLLDVARRTLEFHPEIRILAQRLERSRGVLDAAHGQFDLNLQVSAGERGESTPAGAPPASAASGQAATHSQSTDYAIGLSQQLRFGMTLAPRLTVMRTAGSGIDPAYSQARLEFSITQPLLRGRGASATAARETAAGIDTRASLLRLRHIAAQRLLTSIVAYWNYRAAYETVLILAGAEDRAALLLSEQQRLVEARERAPAELSQLQANLADARAGRADAERAYIEARQELGLAMGIPWRDIQTLAAPEEGFDRAATPVLPTPAEVEQLARLAVERRNDLRAQSMDVQSAGVRTVAARRNLEPQLDLQLEMGYSGLAQGGAGSLFSAVGSHVAGPNFYAGLAFQYPAQNRAARGALRQQQAEQRELEISANELARNISSNVAVTVDVLHMSLLQLQNAAAAVADFRVAKSNEIKKLRANLSTNFDVLLIDARLTAAQLSALRAQTRVMQALVRLRFETGTLIDQVDAHETIALEHMISVPQLAHP